MGHTPHTIHTRSPHHHPLTSVCALRPASPLLAACVRRAEDEGSTEPCAEVDPDSGGCIQPDPPVDGGDGGSEPGILPAPGGTEGGGEGEGEDDVFEGGEGEDDGFEGGEGEVVEGEGGEGGEGSEGGSGTSDCDTDPTGPDCPQVDDGEGGGIGGDPDCVPDPDTNEVPDKCLMYMNEESPACTKGPNGGADRSGAAGEGDRLAALPACLPRPASRARARPNRSAGHISNLCVPASAAPQLSSSAAAVVKCKDNVRGPTGGARGCSCIELWAPVCGADGACWCQQRDGSQAASCGAATLQIVPLHALWPELTERRTAFFGYQLCPRMTCVCAAGKVYANACKARCAKVSAK